MIGISSAIGSQCISTYPAYIFAAGVLALTSLFLAIARYSGTQHFTLLDAFLGLSSVIFIALACAGLFYYLRDDWDLTPKAWWLGTLLALLIMYVYIFCKPDCLYFFFT